MTSNQPAPPKDNPQQPADQAKLSTKQAMLKELASIKSYLEKESLQIINEDKLNQPASTPATEAANESDAPIALVNDELTEAPAPAQPPTIEDTETSSYRPQHPPLNDEIDHDENTALTPIDSELPQVPQQALTQERDSTQAQQAIQLQASQLQAPQQPALELPLNDKQIQQLLNDPVLMSALKEQANVVIQEIVDDYITELETEFRNRLEKSLEQILQEQAR